MLPTVAIHAPRISRMTGGGAVSLATFCARVLVGRRRQHTIPTARRRFITVCRGVGALLLRYYVGACHESADGRQTDHAAIDAEIAHGNSLTTEVAAHGFAHHLHPRVRVTVHVHGTDRGAHEVGGRVIIEEKSGHAVFDGVRETAGPPRHRYGAIPLRAHLGETARLVQRGHQAQIGASEEEMLELFREIQAHGNATRRPLGELRECRLVMPVAVPEKHILRIEGEISGVAEDEVEAFLADEARGEREDGRLPATEPCVALQGDATALLADERIHGVTPWDVGIVRGIPDFLIDAVDDAYEAVAHRHEHAVETEPAFFRSELVRVRGTYHDPQL